jgi:hypothetical protein
MQLRFYSATAALLALTAALSAAPINPPTKPQTVPLTAQEKKNVAFVLDWWREVIYAGHLELAPSIRRKITFSTIPAFPPGARASSNFSRNSASP